MFSLEVKIKSLELPYSDHSQGEIRLLEYQKDLLETEEKLITVKAPTGSGKTLAMLSKALNSVDYGNIALFLYPTNELLYDQLDSFKNLLSELGYDYGTVYIDETGKLSFDNTRILVLPLNGQFLEYLAKERSKGWVINEILDSFGVAGSKLLILSNIDFIYNLVKGCYHRAELSLFDFMKRLSFIAVDELHMYWGTMLFSLLFSLKTLENRVEHILMSSATHTGSIELIETSLRAKNVEIYAKTGEGRKIRHETELRIESICDEPYLFSKEHVDIVATMIKNMSESCDTVLCILNSVIFAEKVADKIEAVIEEKVGRIHGFVPKEMRPEMRSRRVIVGTSSVEVGIDFDREGLIFEANNAPAFLQRFGRIGRHRKGYGIALLPYEDRKRLCALLNNAMSFGEFEKCIWDALSVPRDYSKLKNSESGTKMYLSYLASLIALSKRRYGFEKAGFLKLKAVADKIREYAVNPVFNPNMNQALLESILKPFETQKKIPKADELIRISRIFPRGGMPSVPVFYRKYGTFDMISINNLEKAEVEVVDSNEFVDRQKPYWLKKMEKIEEVPVFVIKDINFSKSLRIVLYSRDEDVIFLKDNKFKILSEWDEEVNGTLERLLENLPAYFTPLKVSDWRFSTLKAIRNKLSGYLVVGGDAFICREMERGYI